MYAILLAPEDLSSYIVEFLLLLSTYKETWNVEFILLSLLNKKRNSFALPLVFAN